MDGEGEISHVSAEIALISRYDSWSPDNEPCTYNKESPLSRVLPTLPCRFKYPKCALEGGERWLKIKMKQPAIRFGVDNH